MISVDLLIKGLAERCGSRAMLEKVLEADIILDVFLVETVTLAKAEVAKRRHESHELSKKSGGDAAGGMLILTKSLPAAANESSSLSSAKHSYDNHNRRLDGPLFFGRNHRGTWSYKKWW